MGLQVSPSAASPEGVRTVGSREVAQRGMVGEILGGICPVTFTSPSPSALLLGQGWALY